MAIKVGGEGPLVKAIKVGAPSTIVKKITLGVPIITPATTSTTLHNIEGVTTAGRQHADVLIYDSSREAPNQKYRSGSLSGGIGIARATNFDSDNPQITFYIDSAELQAHHQRYGHWVDDSSKITFGLDSDLKIYHNGLHSYIEDAGTGSLILATNNLTVQNAAKTENQITALSGGAVTLYFNNGTKLVTTAVGVTISGSLVADSATIGQLSADSGVVTFLSSKHIHADSARIGQLLVDSGHFTTLTASNFNINQQTVDSSNIDILNVETGSINNLQVDSGNANNFSVGQLQVDSAHISTLSANNLNFNQVILDSATFDRLDAEAGSINNLQADSANITTLFTETIKRRSVVTAGTYGTAVKIPVLHVDSSGFIDSATTVDVAGVSSVSFDSASYNYTINTADGGVFTQMIHTRKPGLAAGTHGSATLIPTITVNQYGLVDSVGTVSVAGVSSTSFDSADGTLTINTADGGVFRQIIADSDFTNKRARLAVSHSDAGGDGSFSYDNATGVFTYTGPSASETRAHFSASNSLSYNSGTGDIRAPQPLDSAANPTFNQVRGPATFIIDPAAVGDNTGTVKILGNLQVEGTQTTINSTAITLNDKNIVIADSSADSSALNGGGIIWGGDSVVNNPSFTYAHGSARFVSNRDIEAANFIGNISATTSSADSAIFEHISGRGLNYDSARVNDLKADSGIVTTLSGTNLNYDSAVFGIIGGSTIINASADSNTTHTLGKFRVGSPNNDIMYISHVDQNTASNYALYQSSGGLTNISSVGTLYFNNSNVTNMVLSTTGVGIGEINPNHKLEVVGSTKLRGTLEVTDSAVIKNLSGVGLNFDSSRFQELIADSGVITTISGTNLNYDSATINTLLLPIMGDSNDPALTIGNNQLKIYHDPGPSSPYSASYIDNYSTTLYIRNNTDRASSANIIIQPTPGEDGIIIRDNAGVAIFWDNALKAETIKYGFRVHGTLNTDSATMTNITADSGVITDLSGISINYDSARFNDLHADSAIITNLSTDHFNADSGKLGIITSGSPTLAGPSVSIKSSDFETRWWTSGAGGDQYIEHKGLKPNFVLKDTDATSGNVHNANILWRNYYNGQAGFIGYSSKNDLYIKSQQGGLNIGGNNGDFTPTIAIKEGTKFVGIGNLDSTTDPTHNLHVKGTFLVEDSGRIPFISGVGANYDSIHTRIAVIDSAIVYSGLDMNGKRIILDADNDTLLEAGDDDTVKFTVGGKDAALLKAGSAYTDYTALSLISDKDATFGSPYLDLIRSSPYPGPAQWDFMGGVRFRGNNQSSAELSYAGIYQRVVGPVAGQEKGSLYYYITTAGEHKLNQIMNDSNHVYYQKQPVMWANITGTDDITLGPPTALTADRSILLPDADGTIIVGRAGANNVVDSANIPILSGSGLNYDSARFNDLHADSAHFNTLTANNITFSGFSMDSIHAGHFNADSANINTLQVSKIIPNNQFNKGLLDSDLGLYTRVQVTVNNFGGSNYFSIGDQGSFGNQATVSLADGLIYRFDQSGTNNATHPLRFSTTSDGTHNGGSVYNSDVKYVGTPGTDGAYAQISIIPNGHPQTLYYFCAAHPNMGGRLIIGSPHSTSNLIEGTNLYYTTNRADSDAKSALIGGNNINYDSATGTIAVVGNPAFPNISGNVNISGHIMSSVDSNANIILRRTTDPLTGANNIGAIKFEGKDAGGNDDTYGQIIGKTVTTTPGGEEAEIEIKVKDGGGEHTGLIVAHNGTKLYHVGGQKLTTSTVGVEVTGSVTASTDVITPKVTLPNSMDIDSSATFAAIDSGHVIDQFPHATYRSAKYLLQASKGTSKYQVSELLLLTTGSSTYITQYGTVTHGYGNDSDLVTFDADISGANTRLTVTTTETNTIVKMRRQAIES